MYKIYPSIYILISLNLIVNQLLDNRLECVNLINVSYTRFSKNIEYLEAHTSFDGNILERSNDCVLK